MVPNIINIANIFQDDFIQTDGLSRAEKNDRINEWMDRVLYDPDYTELYRLIFLNFKKKINENQNELDTLMDEIRVTESAVASKSNDAQLLVAYESNVVLLAEASTNLTTYVDTQTPIL